MLPVSTDPLVRFHIDSELPPGMLAIQFRTQGDRSRRLKQLGKWGLLVLLPFPFEGHGPLMLQWWESFRFFWGGVGDRLAAVGRATQLV